MVSVRSMARRALLGIILVATGGCQAQASAPSATEPSRSTLPATSPAAAPPSTSAQPPATPQSSAEQATAAPDALNAPAVLVETVRLPMPAPDAPSIVAFGSIWFPHTETGTLTRWDPSAGRVVETFEIGDPSRAPYGDPKDVVASSDTVFVASPGTGSIARIDPATNRVGDAIALGDFAALALFIDGDSLWAADFDAGVVERIDTRTGRVLATLPGIPQVMGFAAGFGGIWANSDTGGLYKIDPATNTVAKTFFRPGGAGNIAIAGDVMWSASFSAGTVSRLDPESGAVLSTVQLSDNALGVAVVGTSLWVTHSPKPPDCHNPGSSFISRIDLATEAVEGRLELDCPYAIFASGETLWVGNGDAPELATLKVLP